MNGKKEQQQNKNTIISFSFFFISYQIKINQNRDFFKKNFSNIMRIQIHINLRLIEDWLKISLALQRRVDWFLNSNSFLYIFIYSQSVNLYSKGLKNGWIKNKTIYFFLCCSCFCYCCLILPRIELFQSSHNSNLI